MGLFSNLFGGSRFNVERLKDGSTSYWLDDNAFGNEKDFIDWSLSNPVLFSVISTRAKVFSQMQISCINKSGKVVENNDIVNLLYKPNYFQSQSDFLYQYMWFLSTQGENFIYKMQPLSTQKPSAIYNLIPNDLDFKDVMKLNKFISTQKDIKDLENKVIEYKLDFQTYKLPLKDIIPFFDIANGLKSNCLMSSPSRIKAIAGVLDNLEENIKSKNVNLKFSQKYLATNKNNVQGVATQITDLDRKSIDGILKAKSLQITNGDVQVTHLVNDLKRLYLDEQFAADANTVAIAFEMNNDIVNYFLGKSSTFSNQEQGIIRFIQNSIQSMADNFCNSLTNSMGLIEQGLELKASYNHLPVMQGVIKTKLESFKLMQETIKIGLESGVLDVAEAKEMTDKLKMELGI
jgi:hypothetical protein